MIQKNTLLAAISFFSILCSAQTQVGINTTDPKATLDIAAKTDGSTQPEGILIPRLTGEQIKNMPVTASQNSMMVYATLAASPASGIAVNITEPGYYYYQHDAATPANSIWVKVITNKNNEWVYDAATNRINLKRSGTSPFLNTVYYYNATGKFVNKTNTTRNEFDNDLNAFVTTNVTDTGVGNFNEKGSKDLAALAFLRGTQTYHSKTLSENSFYFNDEATASNMYIYANKNNLVTAPSNLANVRFLMASSNSINKSDPKTAIYMAGANNSISINDGNVTEYATATRSEVYLNSPGGINNASSVINFSTVGPRLITTSTLSGVSAGVNYLGNATGGIENAIAYNAVHTINKTFNPFITNLFGYRYLGLSSENTPTNIQNHYGLYLHNIDKATNNWGIYTNAGKNSFGDQVQIRTINANTSTTVTDKIVVADADGVLKTRDASAFNANAWSLTGNASTTAGTNFIGTTDDQPIHLKTNAAADNNPKITILPNGYIGVNNESPNSMFHIIKDNNAASTSNDDDFKITTYGTNSNGTWSAYLSEYYGGTKANPGNVAYKTFNGGFQSNFRLNATDVATASIRPVYLGDGTTKRSGLEFITQGDVNFKVNMFIDPDGKVGIGTSNPESQLHVVADNKGGLRHNDIIFQNNEESSDGAFFTFRRSRGTFSTPQISQQGDVLGGFYWSVYKPLSSSYETVAGKSIKYLGDGQYCPK